MAMAMGQSNVARQFVVLDDGPDDVNDINPDLLENLTRTEEIQAVGNRLLNAQ